MNRRFTAVFAALLVLALFIAVNMIAAASLRSARIDVTDSGVFTLTQGSKAIARSPEEPVKLTLYYSAKLATGRPALESYAKRVRELLEEYARVSGGKVIVEVKDPEPFSQTEDEATQAGLTGVPVGNGQSIYFGLVGANSTDGREIIAFFDPEQERFLEYELSRMIHTLANPKKPVIGLISSLPIMGGMTLDPRTRQPVQTPPWQIAAQLGLLFEIRQLGSAVDAIPDDVDVLLLVHPKALEPRTYYAIDQFVMRGGRVVAFFDPVAETDQPGQPVALRASDPGPLLDSWGVTIDLTTIAGDRYFATRILTGPANNPEPVPYVAWPTITEEGLNDDDAITGNLSRVTLASAGVVRAAGRDGVTVTPLMTTTPDSQLIPQEALGLEPNPKKLLLEFMPTTEKLPLAVRIQGTLTSAFPDGPPANDEAAAGPLAPPEGHLRESAEPANIILIADADLLADGFWLRETMFGLRKIADNDSLIANAVENLAGSSDLISIRARQATTRPFTIVADMMRDAETQYLAEQQLLEEKLQRAETRLRELQQARGQDNSLVLSPEQQAEIEQFRAEYTETRRQLREVKLNLRRDVERLGTQLTLINVAVVPAIVTVFALALAGIRALRRRTARAAAA